MSPIDGLPKWQTIGDLVDRCPGCGGTVTEGFTQDPFAEIHKRGAIARYKATDEELEILKGLFPGVVAAWSVGTKIPTIRTTVGNIMWHEPCYMVAYIRQQQIKAKAIVDLLTWAINRGIFL